ncbi:MAG: DnaJ C-terminal domain-containing protein [Alphaproteobacteria bacterium]
MADDPYTILGVPKDASQDDIRKAYRKLAKDLHPDLHPGDQRAEDRFKAVSAAYTLLSDPDKRAQYDRGEIDASGAERAQGFYRHYADDNVAGRYSSSSGFEDLSDLFTDLFGQRMRAGRTGPVAGADRHVAIQVDFITATTGGKQRLTLPDGQTLDVTIPAGIEDGKTLRLKGRGGPAPGEGPPGDALVRIAVRPHAFFRREGKDIHLTLPISFDEAVLGGKVEVPTLTGRVTMTLPKGANSGDVLRLKGKGIAPAGASLGDMHVTLTVMMPERLDTGLTAFAEEWRRTNSYDPRAKLWRDQ